MSQIEFNQLNTQTNTQETPIKMSTQQSFTPSSAFLKAVEKEMKSYVTALSKVGALNCGVNVALEALLTGREIEQKPKKVKAKEPKMSDEERAEKKAIKDAAKADKKAIKDAEKAEKKAIKDAEKAEKIALKKAAREDAKALKEEAKLKIKADKALADILKSQEVAKLKNAAKTLMGLKKVQMPFLKAHEDKSICKAIVKNGGLYTQCLKKSSSDDTAFCTKCLKDTEASPNGQPKYGLIDNRIIGGFKEGTAPDGFYKSTGYVNFANYLEQKNLSMTDAKSYAAALGLNIDDFPEEYLKLEPKKKRGRKSNSAAVSDSDEEGAKKKRGRPAKKTRAVTPTTHLLSQMLDDSDSDNDNEAGEDDGVEVTKFEHASMPGFDMGIDSEFNIYNTENNELIGKFDMGNDVINFISEDEESELTEEDICDDEPDM